MTVSVRFSDADAALMKDYAAMHGQTVSEIVRRTVIERIEDELDLKAYREAKAAYDADPVSFSLDEVEEALGL